MTKKNVVFPTYFFVKKLQKVLTFTIEKESLLDNEEALKVLVKTLKEKHNISLRKIAKDLNIQREKVRKIYNG